MADQTISHYRILQKLGAGGMGEVYLAEDASLNNRRVALKVLPPDYTSDEERLRRFRQEARAASALNHPHILTIHEVGESEGRQFIATEFVDGSTLRDLLRDSGRLEPREALRIGAQAASALAAAHAAGIVHRDLKPENIMVRRDGYVKVLDFGLAKLTENDAPLAEGSTMTAAHTGAGIVMGTAAYMSPEQATGKPVDARSDVFSLGAVLYELLGGRRAFQADSPVGTLAAIVNQDPKPLPADVPVEVSQLVRRCLRKDPARRYQTMADVKAALEDIREESREIEQARVHSRRYWIPMVAAVVILTALLLWWRPWRAQRAVEPLSAVTLTTLPGVEQQPSLSPDGANVVFAWTGPSQDNQDIYVQMIGQGSPLRRTTDARNDYNPVWSPDGRWIAFLRSEPPAPTGRRTRDLVVIPPLEGPERKLADVRSQDFSGGLLPDAVYLAWSADSRSVIVTDSPGDGEPDALFVVSLDTGEKRRLTTPKPPVLADTSPAISPDGRALVFLRRTSWGAGELHVIPLGEGPAAAGEPRRLTSADRRADHPAWTPDGSDVVFSSRGSLWRVPVSGKGSPTRIPYIGEDGSMPAISRARDGQPARLVYMRSFSDSNFWRIDTPAAGKRASAPPVKAISSSKAEYHIEFSPDGSRVAFASVRSGDPEIFISHPDGSNTFRLTSMRALDTGCPHWSPDGRLIAFSSTLEGEFDVYVVPAAGGRPRRLTSHPGIDINPLFSRDGKWIYFSSMRTGDYRIWKMPADGGEAVQVTPHGGGQVFEDPDGRNLYFLSPSVASPLWRLLLADGQPVKVAEGVVWFNLFAVDKGLYYIDRANGRSRLQFYEFATGRSATVADDLGEVSAGLTATRDGRTILFTRVDASADDLMLVENFR